MQAGDVLEGFFCCFPFVLPVGPSGYVWGRCAFDSSEDLDQFRCLEVEIWKGPKKCEIWFDFRRFGFISIGVPSVCVGGCSGSGRGVDLAAL